MNSRRLRVLTTLKEQRKEKKILSCLVSATLPDRAEEICEKWVPKSRFVVKIDSVKFGRETLAKEGTDVANNEDGDDVKSTKMEADKEATPLKFTGVVDDFDYTE